MANGPCTSALRMPLYEGVASTAKSPLLEWHRTEVSGRVASYGVGGTGDPIVFLHGWGLSGRTYKAALKRLLARGFQVWAPALPGFDGSEALPPGRDDLAHYARWVDEFLAAVGVPEPVVLMGHSFGGGIAIQTAHDWPERVRGLVLINSIGGSALPERRAPPPPAPPRSPGRPGGGNSERATRPSRLLARRAYRPMRRSHR